MTTPEMSVEKLHYLLPSDVEEIAHGPQSGDR